ncbi:MAG: class I SAM-dependent methyltransferase [Isosphaeraceae bacterium]
MIEGDTFLFRGWVVNSEGATLDGFKVALAGEELIIDDLRIEPESPGEEGGSPPDQGAGACRFRIRARPDGVPRVPVQTSAFTLTPFFGHMPGRVLFHLIESRIPSPSEEDVRLIGGGFIGNSCEFLSFFIQLAGIDPDSDVLDVGCGFGRMAYMLAHYLNPTARYEGFDIIEHLIEWAQRSITPSFPNFNFQRVDVYNKCYNRTGTLMSSEYRFPYPNDSFDLVFLSSVFTHMMAPDIRHYLDEIHRVLRPGGRCLTSCFLLNEESTPLVRDGKGQIPLVHPAEECFVKDPELPEDAVGFEESKMLEWIEDRDFIVNGTYYGSWCDRPKFTSFQDILVFQKRSNGWAGRKARDLVRRVQRLKSKLRRSA